MNGLITPLLTGLSVFVATNIDDIVILTLFFRSLINTFDDTLFWVNTWALQH